ncbi:transglutaminase [Mesobaculum littorinae]|uniref:Transglutaminase n=1 Tax=Mesobaculum littorinae TaxID=2486419 RepID=A0A438ALW5_9RHOB|nr:transglutaminase domain-containing protein [Mesobaculum littorinae]RVV99843.1 transglutaminase [Mesobaculum littorinae]
MQLTRRTLLTTGAAFPAAALLPRGARAAFRPRPEGWRRFEIVTEVALPQADGPVQVWVPVPSVTEEGWMQAGDASFETNATRAEIKTDPVYGARFVHAEWDADAPAPQLTVTATAQTQDRHIDLSEPGQPRSLPDEARALYTSATDLIPTDGIVKDTADDIVGWSRGDLTKARKIYDWVVENTERNPETRGCGLGDVASMLAMGDLTGKCADLNALYVGLARAADLPARDVYGVRVAPSRFGYKSLGAGSQDITKAQHCRAEVFLERFGWVAVDPADVRKVMLEEPPKDLSLDDPKVADARAALFGAWEGNWVAYNFAHDVALPGSDGEPVEFLMYPIVEIDGVRQDHLDAEASGYSITATELEA